MFYTEVIICERGLVSLGFARTLQIFFKTAIITMTSHERYVPN